MAEPDLEMSVERAKGIRRLLLLGLVLEGFLVLAGVLMSANGYGRYGGVVILIGVALAAATAFAMRALRDQLPVARRACILTGVLLLVLSIPLMPIWVGLLTALVGIGVLIVVLAPEHQDA